VRPPLLQAFPFPSTLGEVTLHWLSQAGVFIYSSRVKWVLPPLLGSFPPTTAFTSFPAAGCWACATAPAFSSRLVVRYFPSSLLRRSGCPALFAMCLFCCYCLLFSFFFFFPWVGVCLSKVYADLAQGCPWEYHVPLSSPCGLLLPKPSGCCRLVAAWESSWFLFNMKWRWSKSRV
jgi:hypothetical protein